jgi:hypothetical protein
VRVLEFALAAITTETPDPFHYAEPPLALETAQADSLFLVPFAYPTIEQPWYLLVAWAQGTDSEDALQPPVATLADASFVMIARVPKRQGFLDLLSLWAFLTNAAIVVSIARVANPCCFVWLRVRLRKVSLVVANGTISHRRVEFIKARFAYGNLFVCRQPIEQGSFIASPFRTCGANTSHRL